MHFVIKAGLVVVAAFITSSIFVGQRRDGGVWEAAYRNQSIALTQLLSKDPNNIRARDEWGNSPLHWAAKGGSIQSINLLIKLDADPIAPNNAGSTPVHWACTLGRGAAAAAAIASEEDAPTTGWLATAAGETLRALLGADENDAKARLAVSAINNDKETPLHWAVDWQSESAVTFLLSRGADPNALDTHSNTPLHKIDKHCENSETCRRIVARLTRAGANIALANSFGRKALDYFDLGKAKATILPDEVEPEPEPAQEEEAIATATGSAAPSA